ncbi:hypothetical protein BAUCODRAFT_143068 [Baudoinia panamericana UAMH 10762]|uniref:Oxysterol-binding protein n=1 Tax=Baudoinia panamericana (strain UAMH 10762) TaxID=717646 RepID=M2N1P5_BAUPA|nr:uncharacterized protein BAUCODRAFT_143068 [Baudoinia panamericana UAMH 10762]EMC92555.1 hypothetical protein BAUCODRAFT_143068 [Baudoinia panamericana UAMH 10762]
MAENGQHHSSLKQFLASIASIRGDLSSITAPPFLLADKSTTEFPRYWIEHPDLFCAPAYEQTPERRLLAVLKSFLASLRGQQYAGRDGSDGIKKPLNAFLGEIFIGECGIGGEECKLISEQVSHHPPVTACYLWNEKHGVRAEGYTRQEITFNGNVNIQQIGYAIMHLDGFDEDYLLPLPSVKVSGILSGNPYPEIHGTYNIVSSTGLIAEIEFTGKGFFGFGGQKNYARGTIFRADDMSKKTPLFTAEGSWSDTLQFKDANGKVIDRYEIGGVPASEFRTEPLDQQDPWESRKAWAGVIESIRRGDMQGVADHKSALENGQRELRKHDDTSEENWQPLFYRNETSDPVAEKLMAVVGQKLQADKTCGVWKFDVTRANQLERPWRGDLTPRGKQ